jgi:hypothetical protein
MPTQILAAVLNLTGKYSLVSLADLRPVIYSAFELNTKKLT